MFKKLLTNRVVGISSSGGHLSELQSAIPDSLLKNITYITAKDGRSQEDLKGLNHLFIIEPNGVKWKYGYNFIQTFFLFLIMRPSVVISTGSGIVVPYLLFSKFFGSKIIFIESGARIYSASRTGKFMYRYADKFFVQYESLLKYYPDATVGSLE